MSALDSCKCGHVPWAHYDDGRCAQSDCSCVRVQTKYLEWRKELRKLEKVQALPLPSTLALVALIRGADTIFQGERLLEMWLSQHDAKEHTSCQKNQ